MTLQINKNLPLPDEILDDLNTSKFFHKISIPKYEITDIDFNALMVMGIVSTDGYNQYLERQKDSPLPREFMDDVHKCVHLLMEKFGPAGVIAFSEHPQSRLNYSFRKNKEGKYYMGYSWDGKFGSGFNHDEIIAGIKSGRLVAELGKSND